MHIVVEGCDGTGKTGLVNALVEHFGLVVHPRSTPSVGGPPSDLDMWVMEEFARRKEDGIYDRHAVISEPIYGPICRGKVPGLFNNLEWLYDQRQRLCQQAIVVWCEPPWSEVANNVRTGTHMEGVSDNAIRIYNAYIRARKAWPGESIVYDYTRHSVDKTGFITRLRILLREGDPSWPY